jgi:uncharacterized protein
MPPGLDQLTLLDRPEITRLMFYPRPEFGHNTPENALDHLVQVTEGISVGMRVYLAGKDKPSILFFHGNGEIASDYDDVGPVYNRYGINFLVADYRGYGKSNGAPSASALIHDAHIIFAYITGWLNQEAYSQPLFIMGRSLGSASALEIVVNYQDQVHGLILESAFAQTIPLLKLLGIPVDRMAITEKDCFGNERKIERFTKPTLIIHAQYDSIVPFSHAQTLMSLSPALDKGLFMVPEADHNDILYRAGEEYFKTIHTFILRLCNSNPRNKKQEE